MLIETTRTLVSLGTEKMLIDFGKGSLFDKARAQPDKVKQVLQKVKTDGLWATMDAVKSKLDQPIPLGYCHVGVVAGGEVDGFPAGSRVASNGNHAEVVAVPMNLCARIPHGVSDEEAAFTVVGAIGLQGIRLLNPTLGERVVVMGLGLIGLMVVQMLRANGCQVLGIDLDSEKCALAESFGASVCDLSKGQGAVAMANEFTNGDGVDGVVVTASAKTDTIMHDAATMCRKRGRIVLVGVVGLKLQRDDFYKKELSFQVSCSYGPGRHDPLYEGKGYDYPAAFVRWTEQRNLEAVLQLMADGVLNVAPLISHRFSFDDALTAYETVASGRALGILLDYGVAKGGESRKFSRQIEVTSAGGKAIDVPAVSFVGAGNFTTRNLLPSLKEVGGVSLQTIVSGSGMPAGEAARKFGFAKASSFAEEVFSDAETDVVFITTPHNTHASMVCSALKSGKHVFVEKPLAMTMDEVDAVGEVLESGAGGKLMVGFNRRFSPHMQQMQRWARGCAGAKSVVITVNAGEISAEHWTQDREVGGGRVIGEACHFIDLARFLVGSAITETRSSFLGGTAGRLGDCLSIQLAFEDGSIATVHYLSIGNKGFPKERIEMFCDGKVFSCDNFRTTKAWGANGGYKSRAQEKGHKPCLTGFIEAVKSGGGMPIPADELIEVSRSTVLAAKGC